MPKRKHGRSEPPSRSGYVCGCRCDDCVQANRDYQRAYLAKRVKAGIVDCHGRVYRDSLLGTP